MQAPLVRVQEMVDAVGDWAPGLLLWVMCKHSSPETVRYDVCEVGNMCRHVKSGQSDVLQ